MQIGNEYRWNLPVMTYGFHPSFVKTLGTNGVAAVEAAIQILNDLPPASAINIGLYPQTSKRQNFPAAVMRLLDLKSVALMLILEQLGLAQPSRNVWTLGHCNETNVCEVLQRNYSPATLMLSDSVNETAYAYEIFYPLGEALEFPIDPLDFAFSAVADRQLYAGEFYTGLTADHAGGLRYLLSRTNINVESLPPGVTRAGSSLPPSPSAARRPGVEKIRFMKMNWNAVKGRFKPLRNVFTLKYFANGIPKKQALERVVRQPDLLFKAADLGAEQWTEGDVTYVWPHFIHRTGTERWRNFGKKNRSASGEGPGIILPPAVITFGRAHLYQAKFPDAMFPAGFLELWGSFDDSFRPPLVYGRVTSE